jgi:tRNA dimethylallyltransferase
MHPSGCRTFNTLVVLGPTASGKTGLGVQLAHRLGGEVVSADSRQVYRGLDIGSGKDLDAYVVDGQPLPHHLIDVVGLEEEYHLFAYQRDCLKVLADLWSRERLPVLVGGTGMYLEAVLRGYELVEAPEDPVLRAALETLTDEELGQRLRELKPELHNTTDLGDRERMVRAIEIAAHAEDTAQGRQTVAPTEGRRGEAPIIQPLILGTRWPRPVLRRRIAQRLRERLESGLIEEVEHLHAQGHAWERLDRLGLEYRFVAQYLQGHLRTRGELFHQLNIAIGQFAKRQETWFRRMERRGAVIHWVEEAGLERALAIIEAHA